MLMQITRVDGLYMSSELATSMKQSGASFALHKAQLRDSEELVAGMQRKHVFRLMDLPPELRLIILEMAMPGRANRAIRPENRGAGLDEFQEGRDPRFLSATAAVGNELLRQETILVTLQKGTLGISHAPKELGDWLSKVRFDLLQSPGAPSQYQDGLMAVRTAEEYSCIYTNPDPLALSTQLVSRLKNLRKLTVRFYNADAVHSIGTDPLIVGETLSPIMQRCNLNLPAFTPSSLRNLTIKVCSPGTGRHDVVCDHFFEIGCRKVAQLLIEKYRARGLSVAVDVQNDYPSC